MKDTIRRKLRASAHVLGALAAGGAMMTFSACDSDPSGNAAFNQPVNDPNTCQYFGQQVTNANCCQNGAPKPPPTDPTCPVMPGVTAITDTIKQVDQSTRSGDDSNQGALALVGNRPTANGGNVPLGLNATAGKTAPTTSTGNLGLSSATKSDNASDSGLSKNTAPTTNATAGGSGGAGSSGMGGGFGGIDSVRTSAANGAGGAGDGSGNGSGNGADGKGDGKGNGSGDLAYAAGGGAGGGNGSGSGAGRAESEVSLQGARGADGMGGSEFRDPASENLSASGSADPENYFNLLGANDNIFKIVERRYTRKALQWVAPGTQAAAPKAAAAAK